MTINFNDYKKKSNMEKDTSFSFKKYDSKISSKVRNYTLLKVLTAVGIGSAIFKTIGFDNILTMIGSGAGMLAGAYIINSLIQPNLKNSSYLAIGGAVATILFSFFPFSPFFQQFSITFLAAGLAGLFAHYFQK